MRTVMNYLRYVTQTAAIKFHLVKRNTYYIIQTGNSCNTHRAILNNLHKCIPGWKNVETVEECDVILVFCPIVSRAGTDMEAALKELNTCSASKPAVFIVLHSTYDREKIVPDSSRFINRGNTLTVNCLFNEDEGLMKCDMNKAAMAKMIEHIKTQKQHKIQWQRLCSWRNAMYFAAVVLVSTGAYFYFTNKRIEAPAFQT